LAPDPIKRLPRIPGLSGGHALRIARAVRHFRREELIVDHDQLDDVVDLDARFTEYSHGARSTGLVVRV